MPRALVARKTCGGKLDQAFPSAASRDFLGAWLVPKCAHFRGGSIWKVETATLRGCPGSQVRRVPTARALLAGYNANTSPSTHCSSCAPHRLENLLRQSAPYAIWPRTDVRRAPKFDCLIPSLLRPMSHPARQRTRARFGLTATHTGARGVSHPVSCLADILEVLLRAGFVLSIPGTPELRSSAYTLQVALCAQSAIRNLSNACRSILDRFVLVVRIPTCST